MSLDGGSSCVGLKKTPRKSYIYTATPLKLNQQVTAPEKLPKQTANPMPEAGSSDPDPVPIMAFRGELPVKLREGDDLRSKVTGLLQYFEGW